MNAYGIVIFSVLLGASFTFVNGIGLFSTQLMNTGGPTIQQIGKSANVQVSASGLPLNFSSNLGVTPTTLTTTLTFGFFYWVFVQAMPVMISGLGVPGSITSLYFGSGLGYIVNAGMLLVIALFVWEVVGNRNTRPE